MWQGVNVSTGAVGQTNAQGVEQCLSPVRGIAHT